VWGYKRYQRAGFLERVVLGQLRLPLQNHLLRGGLVFKGHRLWFHSTLGSRVIKKKREEGMNDSCEQQPNMGPQGFGLRVSG
jgi:hypothetical protein